MRARQPEAEEVLLDTCAVIWLQNATAMIQSAVEAVFRAARSDGVLISPISAWEIGLLERPEARRSPALQFLPDAKTWFRRTMTGPGIRAAPFTPDIAVDASLLPGQFHNDPADRIIVATARHLAIPIVTRDRRIIDYARAGYVDVIPC